MGWFGSLCSAVGKAVISTGKAVGNAIIKGGQAVERIASKAFGIAKNMAVKACDWIAEKGERFIDNAKEVYKTVKPYLEKARPFMNSAAMMVAPMFPWAAAGLVFVGKVLDHLFALENSEIAQLLEHTIEGVIKTSQVIKERYLTNEEMEAARGYQKTLKQVLDMDLEEKQEKAIALIEMLNNYALLKNDLKDALDQGVVDFQQYLKLRAVQKLLDEATNKLTQSRDIADINNDDIFIVNIAQAMLRSSELSPDDAIRLDEIVNDRFGKSLIPFVFEELMAVWVKKQKTLEKEWEVCSQEVSTQKVCKTRLEVQQKTSELTQEEKQTYEKLLTRLNGLETKLTRLDKERRSMKSYLYAAEGFLQILEKDEETLIKEDKDYLIDDSTQIAGIIIRVASNNIDWDCLTQEEQSLITDYANIFSKEGDIRAQKLAEQIGMEISA